MSISIAYFINSHSLFRIFGLYKWFIPCHLWDQVYASQIPVVHQVDQKVAKGDQIISARSHLKWKLIYRRKNHIPTESINFFRFDMLFCSCVNISRCETEVYQVDWTVIKAIIIYMLWLELVFKACHEVIKFEVIVNVATLMDFLKQRQNIQTQM